MNQPMFMDIPKVLAFGEANDCLATEVTAACQPDPALVASIPAYGAAGAMFSVALTQYLARLQMSGEQLAGRYRAHASAIRVAAQSVAATDNQNAQAIPRPR